MALSASIHRTKSGPAIRGRWLPQPVSAWQIPELPAPTFYPRGQYSELWKITGATSSTTFEQAAVATSLPQPGTTNDTANFVVASIDLQKTDNEAVWFATVNYEVNPLRLPLEINIMTTHQSRERHFVWSAENTKLAIKNSAGDPFSRPIVDDEASARIELVKRMQSFNHALPAEYACHQNSANFLGFSKGRVYCADIRAVLAYDPITHYLVTATFEIQKKNWTHKVTQVGERYWKMINSVKTKITSRDDQETIDCMPVFLDENGYKLDTDSYEPIEKEFDTIPYADFTRLPFFT
jgi:hypothetical protein